MMADTLQITACLCKNIGTLLEGLETVDCPNGAIPEDVSFIPLRRVGSQYVQAKLQPTGDPEMSELLAGAFIECERGIEFDMQRPPQYRTRKAGLTVAYTLWPSDFCGACSWKGTLVTRRNLVTCTKCSFLRTVPTMPRIAVIPDEGEDAFPNTQQITITTSDPECMPGELLMLWWVLLMGGQIVEKNVASLMFYTPAITGGRIIAITDPETVYRKITIQTFDEGELSLVPTDFADYTVGSWVYMLRYGAAEASETDRKSAFLISEGEDSTDSVASLILGRVNRERTALGLAVLTLDSRLTAAATRHASDMAAHDFLSHTGSDGSTSFRRITDSGYLPATPGPELFYKTGENIAVGQTSAAEVIASWMGSPGHRANIIDPVFREIGIAVQDNAVGMPYYCQDFGWRSDFVIDAGGMRPVPVVFEPNGVLVDTSGWTPKELSLVSNFEIDFETAYHEATISVVHHESNTADIVIDRFKDIVPVFEGVEIFYHCPNSVDPTGGHVAFDIDDEVIVLNCRGDRAVPTSADLEIVGFKEELKLCRKSGIVRFALWDAVNDEFQYLYYKLESASVFPTTKPNGDLQEQPFRESEISESLNGFEVRNGLLAQADEADETVADQDKQGYQDIVNNEDRYGPPGICSHYHYRTRDVGYNDARVVANGILIASYVSMTHQEGAVNPQECCGDGVVAEVVTNYDQDWYSPDQGSAFVLDAPLWDTAGACADFYTQNWYQYTHYIFVPPTDCSPTGGTENGFSLQYWPLSDGAVPPVPVTIMTWDSSTGSALHAGYKSNVFAGVEDDEFYALIQKAYHIRRIDPNPPHDWISVFASEFYYQKRAPGGQYSWLNFEAHPTLSEDEIYELFGTTKTAHQTAAIGITDFNDFGLRAQVLFV